MDLPRFDQVLLVLILSMRRCLSERFLNTKADSFFQYNLEKEDFFNKYDVDSSIPVIYHPSLQEKPGLPAWLKFVQSSHNNPGYLYGTPTNQDAMIYELQVIAEKEAIYEMSPRVLLNIGVVYSNQDQMRYQVFLRLESHNVEDFLQSSQLRDEFVQNVTMLWGQGSLTFLYSLTSAKELGLRRPYLGAGISVASYQTPQMDLNATFQLKCQDPSFSTSVDLDSLFHPSFSVDWCQSRYYEFGTSSTKPNLSPIFLGGPYQPLPLWEYSTNFQSFVFFVIIPNGILLVVVLILVYIMFFRREGIVKREQQTPELFDSKPEGNYSKEQPYPVFQRKGALKPCFKKHCESVRLAHHQMIRQASIELRSLSNRRDGGPTPVVSPYSSRAGSRAGSRTGSRMGSRDHLRTPSEGSRTPLPARMTPPPPYRLPPTPRTPRMNETNFRQTDDESRRSSEPMRRKAMKLSYPANSTPDLII